MTRSKSQTQAGRHAELETLQQRIAELESEKAKWTRGEEARLRSEAPFSGMFVGSPIAVFLYDQDGQLMDANANALRYLGLANLETMAGWNLFDGQSLTEVHRAQLARGEPVRSRTMIDFDAVRRMGYYESERSGVAHLEWTVTPVDGFGYMVQIQDITEQKEAEQALEAGERLFRAVFEAIPFPTVLWRHVGDGNFVLDMFNPSTNDMAQGKLAEFIGVSLDEFYQNWPEFPARIRQTFETGASQSTEPSHAPRTTGEEKWLRSVSAKIEDLYVMDSGTDLTDLKLAEVALRESEARYRRLAENAPDIIYRVNFVPDLHIDFVSSAVLDVIGYTPAEIHAMPDAGSSLVHPEDLPSLCSLRDFDAGPVQSARLRWQHKDGEYIWLEHRVVPIHDAEGSLIAMEGIARDITERVKVREALEQTLRDKDLMLKEIHHRIKNNLAIVSSLLDLQAATTDDESVRATLVTSQKRLMAVARVHEILYRSEDVGQINLGHYVRSLTTELCEALSAGEVSIEYDLARVRIQADQAVYYGLILNELLSNAFKHAFPPSDDGRLGTVCVSVHACGDGAHIVVSDDGVGLPPDFENRTTRSLGYQVVSMLTEQMGGTLHYESVPGRGTRFELKIGVTEKEEGKS